MNNEDYVSIEVAKLLKDKEFNERCCKMYNDKEECYYHACYNVFKKGFFNTDLCEYEFTVPTLYEAQKWLRESHNIHVMIGIDDLDWWYQLYDCSEEGRIEEINNISVSVACKKSYEEALNAGILEALKLI